MPRTESNNKKITRWGLRGHLVVFLVFNANTHDKKSVPPCAENRVVVIKTVAALPTMKFVKSIPLVHKPPLIIHYFITLVSLADLQA